MELFAKLFPACWFFLGPPRDQAFLAKMDPPAGERFLRTILLSLFVADKNLVFHVFVRTEKVKLPWNNLGEDAFAVSIDVAPKLDPSIAPPFTVKQGQYLAFIYNYTKIHGRPPAESDMERYFGVSPPAVHEMIKTLERNGLIERIPGQARSIRLLVQSKHLPQLE